MFQRFIRKSADLSRQKMFTVAASERIYAVGDIHGRHDLLLAMLSRMVVDAGNFKDTRRSRFVFLGDYIDRGDQSCDVLTLLSKVKEEMGAQCSFLLGNHEAAMLAFLDDPVRGADWLSWGGRQTLASYGILPVSRDPDPATLIAARDQLYTGAKIHLPFLTSLQRYIVSGDVIFAHASLDPAFALDEQPDAALFWGQTPAGQESGLPGHRLVHGHFDAYEPVLRPERICVDTGAYYSGRLTAVRLDNDETFFHVDAADLMT